MPKIEPGMLCLISASAVHWPNGIYKDPTCPCLQGRVVRVTRPKHSFLGVVLWEFDGLLSCSRGFAGADCGFETVLIPLPPPEDVLAHDREQSLPIKELT